MTGLIDTHSHLQAESLASDLPDLIAAARARGVQDIVICAGSREDWARCADLAHAFGLSYMLGIHPLAAPDAGEGDASCLAERAQAAMDDPHFIGIGEIGIDCLVPVELDKQERIFAEQLRIARRLGLPLSVHVRKSASRLIKYLRRLPVSGGVIHAFNGSDAERAQFLAMGFRLGFGGAASYEGSLRIRRHLSEIPSDRWVIETDAPDMPSSARRDAGSLRTEPADLADTLALAARLRGISEEEAARQSRENAFAAFPRLALRHVC
ncbi:MAG: TatD family hydrolase [Sutterella sp.]|nr:TatD family hydrolase [Sutterella sp.]